MADDEQKSGLEMIVPESKTVELNGTEIEVKPLENQDTLEASMEAEKRGQDNKDFFYELIARTLNENEGFDGITAQEVKESRGNVLPLVMAVQEVNGLGDFLDQEELQEM